MKVVLNRIWQVLTSPRLALGLIIGLTAVSVAGMLFKIDKGPLAAVAAYWAPVLKRFGLDNMFGAEWFLALVIIFFINLLACTLKQIKTTAHRIRKIREGAVVPGQCRTTWSGQDIEPTDVEGFLRQRKYKTRRGGSGRTLSVGYQRLWGFWGASVFHLGLLLVVLGAVISWSTTMSGRFIVTQGQMFADQHQNYLALKEAPWFGENHGAFDLGLDNVAFDYSAKGYPQNIKSRISVIKNGAVAEQGAIDLYKPLVSGSLRFYQDIRFGYTAGIIVKDSDGREMGRFRVDLQTKPRSDGFDFVTSFTIPGANDKVDARLYPDVERKTKKPMPQIYRPVSPGLVLTITRDGKAVYAGTVNTGETARVGAYSLTFDHYRYWSGVKVVNDKGAFVVYTGFWTAILGLALMCLVVPQYVTCRISGCGAAIEFAGFSRRRGEMFSEKFGEMADDLQRLLQRKGKKAVSEDIYFKYNRAQ